MKKLLHTVKNDESKCSLFCDDDYGVIALVLTLRAPNI